MTPSDKQGNEMDSREGTHFSVKPDQGQAVRNPSGEFTVALTEEERAQLLNWLEQRLRRVLVEEHRTDAADYKEYVRHQEEILENVMKKLRRR